nr:hypothetical protein [uncultured Sphaerochaeta sp.]
MSTKIEIIPKWDYEKSVAITKPLVEAHRKLTLDLIRNLYLAQQALRNSGHRSDLPSCQMAQGPRTFEDYLNAIGLPKRTAYNWLFLYNAEEDRLMEPEEARERRDQMLELMFREIEKHLKKDPEWRPEGWNPQLERAYRKWVSELNVVKSLEQDDYKQAELFSRENLRLLAQQLQEDPTPEEMLYQEELCNRYERIVTPLVKVEQQISIARLVEKAVTMFPAQARAEVARSVAKVIMDMSENMEEEK